jgi:hypothetical protein
MTPAMPKHRRIFLARRLNLGYNARRSFPVAAHASVGPTMTGEIR